MKTYLVLIQEIDKDSICLGPYFYFSDAREAIFEEIGRSLSEKEWMSHQRHGKSSWIDGVLHLDGFFAKIIEGRNVEVNLN